MNKRICCLMLMTTLVFPACDLETEVLSGWWMSRQVSEDADQSLLSDTGISLTLGHYGPDVAGVVRLFDGQFESDEYKGHNRKEKSECACSFVENGYYRDGKFTFRIEEGPSCSLLNETGAGALLLKLSLDSDNRLEGTLETQDGENVQPIRFVRDESEDFVRKSDKVCEE